MIQTKRLLLYFAILIAATNPTHSQELSNVHPSLTDKFVLDLGMYFPERSVTIRVDGSIAGINREIDFEKDVNLSNSDETFAMDFDQPVGAFLIAHKPRVLWSLTTEQAAHGLRCSLRHDNIARHVDSNVGCKQPALESGGQLLGLGTENKTGRKQHNNANQHVDGLCPNPQYPSTEQGQGIDHSQAEEDLKEVLHRDVVDIKPAIAEGGERSQEAAKVDRRPSSPVPENGAQKRQQHQGHRGIDQVPLRYVLDHHDLSLAPQIPRNVP